MKKFRWGIIGTGKIAHTFAEALAGCEDAELYAVASRTIDKAQQFAEKYGFAKSYGSYQELADDADVDVVYIATPMASHYGDSKMCLNAEKNVLCEKTVALNERQLEEILTLAKEKDLFFMEAMWMKCRPVYLNMMEWIKSGKIGTPKYIKADFSNYIPYDPNDRLFRLDCGGGALLDLGVYPLTLADALFGTPDEIISTAHIGSDGVDLHNTIQLRYNDGRFASMDNGFEIQLSNNAVISGTDGYITLGRWFHCTCESALYSKDGKLIEEYNHNNDINGYEYEIREVHRCLDEGLKESPLIPHCDTMRVMKLMDECRRQWNMKFDGE